MSVLLACPDRADVPLPSAISTAVWTRDSENRPGHGRKKRYSTDLMNRYLAPITVVLLSLAGCVSQSQVPKCDPFFGRTTIPPPPTGSAAGRCADPYYQTLPGVQTPPPPQSPGCPPASSAAPASPPGAASTWAVPRGGAANASPPPSNPSSSAIAPSQLAPRPPLTAPPPSRTAAPPAPYGNPPPAAPGNPLPPSSPPAPLSAAPPAPSSSGSPGARYGDPSSAGIVGYRGVSLQGARSAVTRPDQPPALSPSASGSGSFDDHVPRPTDNTAGDRSLAGQKPIVRTLQPRGSDDASDRPVVEIGDLPKDR